MAVNLTVDARKFASIEAAIRKFRRIVTKSGVLDEYLKHEYFLKPSARRRQKELANKRRRQFNATLTAR